MAVKLTKAFMKAIIDQIKTAGLTEDGVLAGCKLYLFTNAVAENEELLFDELTQPTFTGYAASAAVTWSATLLDEDNTWRVHTDMKTFQASGGTPDDEIVGAALAFGANPNEVLYAFEVFDEPVVINAVGEGLSYSMSFRLPHAADYGSGSLVA